MSIKEFLGHCFCDYRFQQLTDMIKNGSVETVLEIKQLNNTLYKNSKHQQIKELINERLKI